MAGQRSGRERAGAETGAEAWSAEERSALRERAQELKAAKRQGGGAGDGAQEVRAKIAAMADDDRALAERIHAIVTAAAPDLSPRLWYGMPAYAKDGKVICFFRSASTFKTRYATLGFSDAAHLDQGSMWPTDFALMALTETEEAQIVALIRQALD